MTLIDFKSLIANAGSEDGARILFQRLVASLIKIKYQTAREIRPSQGDWGIDVIVGDLSGHCLIWQVKYFINGIGSTQRQNIKDSFDTLVQKSKEEQFEVDVWTLCIPCSLSPRETKWWNKWKNEKNGETNIQIELWDETDIRTELELREAEHLKSGYFSNNPTIIHYLLNCINNKLERDIHELPEPHLFSDALFIQKLKAAGILEFTSAKTQFFNAELLTQEIIDKGELSEINSLKSLKEKLRSLWETRFNEVFTLPDEQIIHLYVSVMKVIEDQDQRSLMQDNLMATLIHKQGIIHQLSNNCQVGWTKNFREKFADYYEDS